jgi:hypothetical protein
MWFFQEDIAADECVDTMDKKTHQCQRRLICAAKRRKMGEN